MSDVRAWGRSVRRAGFVPVLACLVAACPAGCARRTAEAELLPQVARGAAEVRTQRLAAGRAVEIGATGTLFPDQETIVIAEVPGKVVRLHAEEGDLVKAGAVLVELEATDYLLNLRKAEADLRGAELALATTRQEFDRSKRLFDAGSLPQAAFDGMKLKLDLTENGAKTAAIGLDFARRRLGQATLRAPYDALVVNRLASIGTVVQVMPPTVMYRLQDARRLRLKMKVPELAARNVAVGDRVEARFESLGLDVATKVASVVASVDPMSRTFDAVAEIDNGEHGMALRPGSFATVRLFHDAGAGVLMLPRDATLPIPGATGEVRVFVVEDGKARERRVKVAPIDGSTLAVTGGLKEGDALVTSDLSGLSDGLPVSVGK